MTFICYYTIIGIYKSYNVLIYSVMEQPKKKKQKTQTTQQEVTKLKQQCQTYLDGWQRERADFQNYKQNNEKYIAEIRNRAKESVIFQLLVVIDNIDLIVQHAPEDVASTNWYKGVEQVHKQVKQSFGDLGLKEIDCSGAFNPLMHEAVEGQGETIESVVQKGYTLDNAVIRPAKVKIKK